MYAAPHRDRERIDGLATFVAAAFLTALGLVAALARVGAPTGSSPHSGLWSP